MNQQPHYIANYIREQDQPTSFSLANILFPQKSLAPLHRAKMHANIHKLVGGGEIKMRKKNFKSI